MAKKNLPLGAQDFKSFKEYDYIYVDKTEHIYRLATEGRYYFLSRPRRFGKSLLISTMKELFQGNQKLFEDLWIEDKWDWSKKHPVIHISFAKADYQGVGLEKAIDIELNKCAEIYGLELKNDSNKSRFEALIVALNAKYQKVVVLVDEYDKPIIDYLEEDKLAKARENQEILKAFYSVLKDSEQYLAFVFITGVSKFSKVSIFSDLNHLTDLTMREDYATILGYTQEELEGNFKDYLAEAHTKFNITYEELLSDMRLWYNGFSWDGKSKVYNPFGTLNFLASKDFHNFWFATGTPTFLAHLMKQQIKFDYENIHTTTSRIDKYSLDNLDLVSLLFQTGYLTLKKRDFRTGDIVLDFPNREIRESMYVFMLDYLRQRHSEGSAQEIVRELSQAFHQNNLEQIKALLEGLFRDLPSNLFETDDKRSERFYHSIIHLTFKFLGIYIDSEVRTARGRADSVVQTATHIYIFEFKHKESAEAAFQQILDRDYLKKYIGSPKTIVGIGINFDKDRREIDWVDKVLR